MFAFVHLYVVCIFYFVFTPSVCFKYNYSKQPTRDFEFVDYDKEKQDSTPNKPKKSAVDPWLQRDLCSNLQCKPYQVCVVKNPEIAICISKKKLKPKEQEKHCTPCPLNKPEFVCGSDNQTYSSPCRLEFTNCLHHSALTVMCSGFCPCKKLDPFKAKLKEEHWNSYLNKYHATVHKKLIKKQKTDIQNVDTSKKGCTEHELRSMGDRLLDWFTVVMADHKRGLSRRRSFRLSHTDLPNCRAEVSWMFQHLDTDGDLKLSLQELYDLEHDDKEVCLKPYLLDCDTARDYVLSPSEWCACFDKSQRPCAAALRRVSSGLLGGYVPQCDPEGYYLPTQCHPSTSTCWCVDRHGLEFTNTRRMGRPDCEGLLRRGPNNGSDEVGADDDDEDDDDNEGSADKPLDF